MENLISVIVCTYNQEDTIGRTLDSILMQQCHLPFEIIIGEDCSSDHTLNICQQYAKKHPDIIHLIANHPNKGIVDNYFDCILASKGEYIADCAGDDFWIDPLKLEKEVNILETHPEVTLVHTNWASYHEATKTSHPSPSQPFPAPFTKGKLMLESIIVQRKMPVIHLCTSLYRASTICHAMAEHKSMFRNKDFVCEDIQTATFLAAKGDIAYLPDVTLNYSQGKETISFSHNSSKLFHFTKQATHQSYLLAQHFHIKTPVTAQFFSQRIFELGMHAFRLHDEMLFDETLQTEKDWQAIRNMKTSLLFYIMRHTFLWSAALKGRKAFVTLKRLFH